MAIPLCDKCVGEESFFDLRDVLQPVSDYLYLKQSSFKCRQIYSQRLQGMGNSFPSKEHKAFKKSA